MGTWRQRDQSQVQQKDSLLLKAAVATKPSHHVMVEPVKEPGRVSVFEIFTHCILMHSCLSFLFVLVVKSTLFKPYIEAHPA